MAKINDRWIVQPHGPIERIDNALLSVAGEIRMPLGRFPRRMTVIGLRGRRTAIWSAIPLAEPAMAEIEALGEPSFLIVPGIAHRLDLRAWKLRYPAAQVICPPGAVEAVTEAMPVDATTGDGFDEPSVRFEAVPGVGGREAALIVCRAGRATLLLNDILANVRRPQGLGAHVMARLMGFGVSRPQMPWVGRRMFVEDRQALAAAFRAWADEPHLARIIVSHGDVIERDPKDVLRRVADELEG